MYCPNCGAQIDDLASICIHCGQSVKPLRSRENASALWWWLGFFIPTVGLILWAVMHGESPAKAKKALVGALWGIGVSVILSVLVFILYFVIIGRTFYTISGPTWI